MGISFASWSGVESDCIENDVHMGGATCFRLLTCLEIPREETGRMELDRFAARLREAMDNWGPASPGYPDANYVRAYGRDHTYIMYWMEQLDEMCVKGQDAGHRFIVWA